LKKLPYKILKSKVVYSFGREKFKVFEDILKLENGEQIKFVYTKKKPFVTVIAHESQNNFYLVGEYRPAIKRYSWGFPSGGIKNGESALSAAKRELKEEAGLSAKKWKYLGSFYIGVGSFNQKCHVFEAKNLKRGKIKCEKVEFLMKVKKISLKEINNWIQKNKIFEGPTIAALYKYLINQKSI
jgi:ADP-ribose pyrophosphatase